MRILLINNLICEDFDLEISLALGTMRHQTGEYGVRQLIKCLYQACWMLIVKGRSSKTLIGREADDVNIVNVCQSIYSILILSAIGTCKIEFAFGSTNHVLFLALIKFDVQLLFQGAVLDGDTVALLWIFTSWKHVHFPAKNVFACKVLVEVIALELFLLLFWIDVAG